MSRRKGLGIVSLLLAGMLLASPVWGAAGGLLWEQSFNYLPLTYVNIDSTVASKTRFFVAGSVLPSHLIPFGPNPGTLGFIKAFDAATGVPQWEHTVTKGNSNNSIAILALDNDLIITKEVSQSKEANSPYPFTLLENHYCCYQADTGALLWDVQFDWQDTLGPTAAPIVVSNNRVYTVQAFVDNYNLPTGNMVARAYQERNIPVQTLMLLE